MVLTGLSSREGLLTIAFFQTSWWGTAFIGGYVTSLYGFLVRLVNNSIYTRAFDMVLLGTSGTILLLNFLATGILWRGIIWEEEKRTSAVRCGLIVALILEIIWNLFAASHVLVSHSSFIHTIIILIPSLIIRIPFWILIQRVYRTVSCDTENLYPGGFWMNILQDKQSLILPKAFLLWEIFWYGTIVIGTMLFPGKSQIPLHNVDNEDTITVYGLLILMSFFLLLAILRNWNLFMKFLILMYFLLGVLGYTAVNALEIIRDSHHHYFRRDGVELRVLVGITLSLIGIIIRFLSLRQIITHICFTQDGIKISKSNLPYVREKEPLVPPSVRKVSE